MTSLFSRILPGAFAALAFVAGSGAGYLIGHVSDGGGAGKVSTNAAVATPSFASASATRTAAGADRERSATVDDEAVSDLTGPILTAVRHRDYFRRKHDLFELGMSLDREGIAAAMEATRHLSPYDREWAGPTLIARWLDLDPDAAFAFALKVPPGEDRDTLQREFFHSLGLKNPTLALDYLARFATNPNRGSQNYFSSVFEAWSAHDPAAAVNAALSLPNKDARSSALYASVQRWAIADPQGALARLGQIPDAALRQAQIRSALAGWAETQPQAAAAYAQALPAGRERNDALGAVIAATAENDTTAAFDLLSQIPDGPARAKALDGVIQKLRNIDPALAAETMLSLPATRQQNLVYQVAYSFAQKDPGAAIEWAGRLATPELRARAVGNIVGRWAGEDPRAAAEYCIQNPDPDRNSLGNVVSTWMGSDPAAALAWARGISDAKTRDSAITSGLGTLAASDPQQALGNAGTMLQGDARKEALASIAGTWAGNDPAAAAAWAQQHPEVDALGNIARQWATQDPATAAAWIEKFPAGDRRDTAVSAFASAVVTTDPAGAAAWAATIANADQRQNSIQQAVWQWRRQDKVGARTWLQQTPAVTEAMRTELLRNLGEN